MLMVAVWSGVATGRLLPHCIYTGSPESSTHRWLVDMGVHILQREPRSKEEWAPQMDLPQLGLPYEYIFYSDAAALFLRRVNLIDFGDPLPDCLGMVPENDQDERVFDAGVMLVRLPCLMDSHTSFLSFVTRTRNPRGAFSDFYGQLITKMPSKWNTAPHHDWSRNVAVAHFSGPQPRHFDEFTLSGVCGEFGDLCERGLRNAAPAFLEAFRAVAGDVLAAAAGMVDPPWRRPEWSGGAGA